MQIPAVFFKVLGFTLIFFTKYSSGKTIDIFDISARGDCILIVNDNIIYYTLLLR